MELIDATNSKVTKTDWQEDDCVSVIESTGPNIIDIRIKAKNNTIPIELIKHDYQSHTGTGTNGAGTAPEPRD